MEELPTLALGGVRRFLAIPIVLVLAGRAYTADGMNPVWALPPPVIALLLCSIFAARAPCPRCSKPIARAGAQQGNP